MTVSTYLALIFGAYITVVAILMLWDERRLVKVLDDFLASPPLILLSGILAMIGGLSVIAFHNIWVADWRSLITLFGWIAAIEGAWLILAPGPLIRFSRFLLEKFSTLVVLGFIYLGLGVFLLSRVFF